LDEGVLMAGAMPWLQLGGAVLGAVGNQQAGNAQSAVYSINSDMHERAAAMERQMGKYNAAVIRESAKETAEDVRRKGERDTARTTVAFAASGIESFSGTASDVVFDETLKVQRNMARIIMSGNAKANMAEYNASRLAWNHMSQAQIADYQGGQASAAGDIGALGSLIGGAYDIASTGGFGIG
jgi:hypothetical protein